MEKRELEFSTRLTREDVAGLVEALIEGLKDGHLRVQKSDEVLELEVPRVVDLEIEAKIDDERAEFEIEVSWRTNRAENPDNAPDAEPADAKRTTRVERSRAATHTAASKPAKNVESGARAAEARKSVRKNAAPDEAEGAHPLAGRKVKKATGRAAVAVARAAEAAAGIAPTDRVKKKSGRKSVSDAAAPPDAASAPSED